MINETKLFDQFCNIQTHVKDLLQAKGNIQKLTVELWNEYFMKCSCTDVFSELLKIARFFFAIPPHNANVKRIFSLVNSQWTKERNCLEIPAIKGLIQTVFNFKQMNCKEFYSSALKNKTLLLEVGNPLSTA